MNNFYIWDHCNFNAVKCFNHSPTITFSFVLLSLTNEYLLNFLVFRGLLVLATLLGALVYSSYFKRQHALISKYGLNYMNRHGSICGAPVLKVENPTNQPTNSLPGAEGILCAVIFYWGSFIELIWMMNTTKMKNFCLCHAWVKNFTCTVILLHLKQIIPPQQPLA